MTAFLCRLFVQNHLQKDLEFNLEKSDAHYLKNVLRAEKGHRLRLFNSIDGEFSGEIIEVTKNNCMVRVESLLRPQTFPPQIVLYFAPLRQNRMDILIEKTVELGVLEFRPILTDFTQVRKINLERIQLQIKEASEQSEQLHIAKIFSLENFDQVLKSKNLWICDESRTGKHLLNMQAQDQIHILIGPEGGFSPREKTLMENHTKVSLGNSILRAETAAICSIGFTNYLLTKS